MYHGDFAGLGKPSPNIEHNIIMMIASLEGVLGQTYE